MIVEVLKSRQRSSDLGGNWMISRQGTLRRASAASFAIACDGISNGKALHGQLLDRVFQFLEIRAIDDK